MQRKTGGYNTELWAYIKKELQPTLSQLGILTPEEMGYDKPELALQDVYDMWDAAALEFSVDRSPRALALTA